ncbi:DUF2515 domain-containing protein [Oceanobacillus jeddahense]|uniref:DUF2515 domain-containing protein n=1 Tax=Oceanobacillus jeddahense TaxID=1462527 RepID=A0ABY5JTC9_9BACI|nr:DUF2515 domain-containing protein [Oceanobacillus jeddahense]UUI03449.1 DUF2515 domain-containing protein [Oceanobacillus jeddahense]
MTIGCFQKKKVYEKSVLEIKKELKNKRNQNTNGLSVSMLPKREQILIRHIHHMTNKSNKNNVTRTQAYFDFYVQHPEIHWALLGHMVSRNGGWSMTDLKGDLLSRLLSEKEQKNFYLFLERGNWLIFQDVYPQLLLYQYSVKMNRNLFHLLPFLNVSIFMEVIWNHFWEHDDRYLLAIATIINEQSYLEQRVVHHPHFKETALDTLGFKLYDFLRFNHVIFPYYPHGKTEKKPALIGDTLHHFGSLHERIMLGKRLYTILFQQQASVLRNVLRWANKHPHTGSRADYWGDLFHSVNESVPGTVYRRRTKHCTRRKGAPRIYSPPLKYAWKNVNHSPAETGDWFNDLHVIDYFVDEEKNTGGEIYEKYCKAMEKIELAIIAKKAIFLRQE